MQFFLIGNLLLTATLSKKIFSVLFLVSHPEVKAEHLAPIEKIMSGAAPLPHQDIVNILDKKVS